MWIIVCIEIEESVHVHWEGIYVPPFQRTYHHFSPSESSAPTDMSSSISDATDSTCSSDIDTVGKGKGEVSAWPSVNMVGRDKGEVSVWFSVNRYKQVGLIKFVFIWVKNFTSKSSLLLLLLFLLLL